MDRAELLRLSERGRRAKVILDDELFVETFEALARDIRSAWEESGAEDEKQRENCYLMLRILKDLRHRFMICVKTGERARIEFEKYAS